MNLKMYEQVENNFINIIAESNKDERFEKNEIYTINGKKYKVFYSKLLNKDKRGFPLYDVSLQEIIRTTHHDYSSVDFFHIFRIERVSPTRFVMLSPVGHHSEHNFNTPEDCLHDYLEVRRMWGENYGTI